MLYYIFVCFFLCFLLFVSRFSLAMCNLVFIILMCSVFFYSRFQAAIFNKFELLRYITSAN